MEFLYREEGLVLLLWRFFDFKLWVQLCLVEFEVGYVLMCLVISGCEILYLCEVFGMFDLFSYLSIL